MQGALILLAGSTVAVLLLALLATQLGLGGDPRLRDEATARAIAEAAVCGFDPVEITFDRAGIGALLRDGEGRVMLIRRHGARFVARLLDGHADTRLDHNFLTIATSERRFGAITLDLGPKAQVWAGSFRRLGS
jgi:hypothetical protein